MSNKNYEYLTMSTHWRDNNIDGVLIVPFDGTIVEMSCAFVPNVSPGSYRVLFNLNDVQFINQFVDVSKQSKIAKLVLPEDLNVQKNDVISIYKSEYDSSTASQIPMAIKIKLVHRNSVIN